MKNSLSGQKRARNTKPTTHFMSKQKASTEEEIKHVVEPVVIAVHVFGRKILCLVMMITKISKKLHASNVSRMGTW